jgi:hypothetical protein
LGCQEKNELKALNLQKFFLIHMQEPNRKLLGRIDSWRNILSNKISALYRVEAKDVIDLWALAKIKSFSWAEIIREASSKEAGLDPVVIYDLLKSFPKEELSAIKWIGQGPNENIILGDLSIMADEIFEGMENSLTVKKENNHSLWGSQALKKGFANLYSFLLSKRMLRLISREIALFTVDGLLKPADFMNETEKTFFPPSIAMKHLSRMPVKRLM